MKLRQDRILFIILLVSVSSLTSTSINLYLSYFLVLFIYTISAVLLIDPGTMSADRIGLVAIFIIIVFFCIQIGVAKEWTSVSNDFSRTLVFAIFGFLGVFYIPTRLRLQEFLYGILIVSTGSVIIGFVTIPLETGLLDAMGFVTNGLRPYSSLFNNPNAFATLTKYGVVSGAILYFRSRNTNILYLLSISFAGLLLSQGHSEILAALVAVVLYWWYQYSSMRTFQYALGTILLIGGALFVYILLIPDSWMAKTFLPRRRFLWTASVEAISRKPFLGYGLGYTGDYIEPVLAKSEMIQVGLRPDKYKSSHNSFLRMFLSVGVIGGLSYFYLFIRGFLVQMLSGGKWRNSAVLCLLFSVMISHTFQAYLIFGLRMQSILAALILGYALQIHRPTRTNQSSGAISEK